MTSLFIFILIFLIIGYLAKRLWGDPLGTIVAVGCMMVIVFRLVAYLK